MRTPLICAGLLATSLLGLGFTSAAGAAGAGNNACPVGLVRGLTLDEEFGPDTQDLTRCLERRHKVKVVVQINQFCRDAVPNASCTRPYALGNIQNMIDDYEITHGMLQGRDYEIVAVVHGTGGWQMLKSDGLNGSGASVTGRNQFEPQVRDLLAAGVRFYFCQNTTRAFVANNTLPTADETAGGATAELIEGVEYTTAGVTALADFQSRGYTYVQP
jgi:intracellular sulfur oxidation DsrE/DsrF family protein